MSERTLRHLLLALGAVVLLWLAGTFLGGGRGDDATPGELVEFFDAFTDGRLDRVEIVRGDRTVRLGRDGDAWTVNGWEADTASVSRLMRMLGEARVGELVAANPSNHDRMGVSADSAWQLTLGAGDDEGTLLVGRSGRRFATAYVRLPGEDEVYLLEGDLRAQVTRDVDAWRNRIMVSIDTAEVARIVVEHGANGYALVRGDSAWSLDNGAEAAPIAVDGILSELARMVASGFVAEGDSLATTPASSATTALDAEGGILAEVRFGTGEGDRWARVDGGDVLYRVTSFRVGRVAPERDAIEPGG